MPPITVSTEVVEEMPESRYGRSGQWIDLMRAAAADRKPRATKGIPEDKMDAVRRQLSHTANSAGYGVITTIKNDVIYWQIVNKRARVVKASHAEPPTEAGSEASASEPAEGDKRKAS